MVWVRSPVYFYNRNGTYYFSRAIPSDLRHRFPKRKIEVSLRTKTESKAARSAAALSDRLERYWDSLRMEMIYSKELGLTVLPESRAATSDSLSLTDALALYHRLADFAQDHPDTELRVEPINTTADLKNPILDLSVFWCSEDEGRRLGSQLYASRTVPLANPKIAKRAREMGIVNILNEVPLLPDASGMEGWKLWHKLAGINYAPRHKPLHLPDANSRLQAVISGDGVALLDDLARPEIDAGFLTPISQVALDGYGYYVIRGPNKSMSETTKRFKKWLKKQPFKC